MNGFTLISKENNKSNPFIFKTLNHLPEILGDDFYLIESAELAYKYYPDFDFNKNKINNQVYWVDTYDKVEDLIIEILSEQFNDIKIIYDFNSLKHTKTIYYYKLMDNLYYFSDGLNLYHIDFNIINLIEQKDLSLKDKCDNLIGFDDIKVTMKEIEAIDEVHSYESFDSFLKKYSKQYLLLLLIRDLYRYSKKNIITYNIDNEYNNPYQNILSVENYLNAVEINTIDIKKSIDYDLKIDKLPAKYNYSGFYSVTGRIFCSSDQYAPLQTIAKSKRDILYAESNCILVEIDYKSFEMDLLCQIIGMKVSEDPHIEIYNRLVGIDADFELQRNIGKTINYSFIYGSNLARVADKVINDLKIKDPNFKETFIENLSKEFIMIGSLKLIEKLNNEITDDNIIENYFGRKIQCKKSHAVLNNYISSTAADFLYNKMIQIIKLLSGDNKIILQNHDSILLQLSNDSVANTDIFEEILTIMELPISNLKGRVSYSYGNNWKELL